MPLIDMPLEKLREYQGISPKPVDFEQYWDKSIAELEALDMEVELVEAEFQTPNTECFHLYFTGVNGSRVYAKYLRPRDEKRRNGGAVLQFHGYTGSSWEWSDKLAYVNEGFTYLALDTRGQCGLSQDLGLYDGTTWKGHIIRGLSDEDPKKLYYRYAFLDCLALVNIARTLPGVNPDKIGAWGISQGGALTTACAALAGSKLNRAYPVYPFLSDYRRVWEMDLCKNAYEELVYFFRWFDPRHEREDEIFNKLGYIDIQNLAPRISCKFTMLTGLMDTICPPSTQFAMYNKVTSDKNVIIYPDFGHENLPDHHDMLMQYMLEMVK